MGGGRESGGGVMVINECYSYFYTGMDEVLEVMVAGMRHWCRAAPGVNEMYADTEQLACVRLVTERRRQERSSRK